jgi:glc operon protein GlcG
MALRTLISLAFGAMLVFPVGASAQQAVAEQAKKAAEAAEAEAKKNSWHVAIAVVSGEGNLIYLGRVGAPSSDSDDVATRSATSAAAGFRRAQEALAVHPQARPSLALSASSDAGMPLFADGKMIGAIGCSGATVPQNLVACRVGAVAIR